MCKYELLYVKTAESYRLTDRQTDTTEIIHHAASRVVRNRQILPKYTHTNIVDDLNLQNAGEAARRDHRISRVKAT